MATYQVGADVTVYWATGSDYGSLCNHAFGSGTALGCANIMSYTVEEGTEGYYGAGRRYPWGIKGGQIEVTVHLEGLWIDENAWQFWENQAEATGALTAFAIGATGSTKGVVFSGCRLGSFEVEFDAEGWCTETVDIPALLKV